MVSLRFVWAACLVCISASNLVSGGRQKTSILSDVCSTKYQPSVHGPKEEYYNRVRDEKHIPTRLLRYFTFGGILQAISEKTEIPRDEIVKGGAMQFQDRSSDIPGTHAAHVIRVGAISEKLQEKSPSLRKALENYIGHTQIVSKKLNVWHGIGGAIDLYQSSNLTTLAKINFNGQNFDNCLHDILTVRDYFIAVIDAYVVKKWNDDSSMNRDELEELNEDRNAVYLVDECFWYEEGVKGYEMVNSGKFVSHYIRKNCCIQ